MNTYNGKVGFTPAKHAKGYSSEVAQAAFDDIRNDPTMKVRYRESTIPAVKILDETFLETTETFL